MKNEMKYYWRQMENIGKRNRVDIIIYVFKPDMTMLYNNFIVYGLFAKFTDCDCVND